MPSATVSRWTSTLLRATLLACGVFAQAPQVKIGNTVVTGLAQPQSNTQFYGGIPFAKPPVGNLRFAPPVITYNLTGPTFNATAYGPGCKQVQDPRFGTFPDSEDCLFVDVIRPAGPTTASKLPVMVWIHGGGFNGGAPSQFNGTQIVQRSVARGTPTIYVSIAYRVGALGFPGGIEATAKGLLNLGLKDQIAGLKWVQQNIGAFGGDKTKVTVFGESAGSSSIAFLYLNSNLSTLARGAILESGGPDSRSSPGNDTLWKTFAKAVPTCANTPLTNTLTCLRQATVQQIIDAQASLNNMFPFWPVVDGPGGVIPDKPKKLWDAGKFAKVPFIGGTNLDEGTFFVSETVTDTASLREWLKTEIRGVPVNSTAQNQAIDGLLLQYPDNPALGSPFGTGNETFGRPAALKRGAAMAGDMLFQSQVRAWLGATSRCGVKVYGYHFTDPQLSGPFGVHHAAELPYIFGPTPGLTTFPTPPGLSTLSPIMQDYWLSFVSTLNPNDGKGSTRPTWPLYTQPGLQRLELKSSGIVPVKDDFRKDQIAYITANSQAFFNR